MPRIYVASSWRNKYQPEVVAALRKEGHEVYDFPSYVNIDIRRVALMVAFPGGLSVLEGQVSLLFLC